MKNYVFDPSDIAPHTIVNDPDGKYFKSGLIILGSSFSRSFDSPGEYNYHRGIHPYMKGKIIVQEVKS